MSKRNEDVEIDRVGAYSKGLMAGMFIVGAYLAIDKILGMQSKIKNLEYKIDALDKMHIHNEEGVIEHKSSYLRYPSPAEMPPMRVVIVNESELANS